MTKKALEENLAIPGECFVRREGCTGRAIDPNNDSRYDPVNAWLDVNGFKPWEACQACRDSISREMAETAIHVSSFDEDSYEIVNPRHFTDEENYEFARPTLPEVNSKL